jgi:hypothetical protein
VGGRPRCPRSRSAGRDGRRIPREPHAHACTPPRPTPARRGSPSRPCSPTPAPPALHGDRTAPPAPPQGRLAGRRRPLDARALPGQRRLAARAAREAALRGAAGAAVQAAGRAGQPRVRGDGGGHHREGQAGGGDAQRAAAHLQVRGAGAVRGGGVGGCLVAQAAWRAGAGGCRARPLPSWMGPLLCHHAPGARRALSRLRRRRSPAPTPCALPTAGCSCRLACMSL